MIGPMVHDAAHVHMGRLSQFSCSALPLLTTQLSRKHRQQRGTPYLTGPGSASPPPDGVVSYYFRRVGTLCNLRPVWKCYTMWLQISDLGRRSSCASLCSKSCILLSGLCMTVQKMLRRHGKPMRKQQRAISQFLEGDPLAVEGECQSLVLSGTREG
jgi:hypothetical protein